jgi:ankyrin repeat protein
MEQPKCWRLLGDANIHADNDIALCNAAINGHLAVVECLINHGANIYANNNRAFRLASENGHLAVIECLIRHSLR